MVDYTHIPYLLRAIWSMKACKFEIFEKNNYNKNPQSATIALGVGYCEESERFPTNNQQIIWM